jgi:hypothetical protein
MMQIYVLTHVTVLRQKDSSLVVHAHGLTSAPGWKNVRLSGPRPPNPEDAILTFDFEGERPGAPFPNLLTHVSASIVWPSGNGVDAIVVEARINLIAVHASRFSTQGAALTTTPPFGAGSALTSHSSEPSFGAEGFTQQHLPLGEGAPMRAFFGREDG